MPAPNCAIVGCSATKYKNRGLSFHTLPTSSEDKEWRLQLIHKIGRSDSYFNPHNAVICSRHFTANCFRFSPSGQRKYLIKGSLPTECMPTESIEILQVPGRKSPDEKPKRARIKTLWSSSSTSGYAQHKLTSNSKPHPRRKWQHRSVMANVKLKTRSRGILVKPFQARVKNVGTQCDLQTYSYSEAVPCQQCQQSNPLKIMPLPSTILVLSLPRETLQTGYGPSDLEQQGDSSGVAWAGTSGQ